jgi:hypothetical protein
MGFFSVVRSVYSTRQNLSFWRHLTFVIAGIFDPTELIEDDSFSTFDVDQLILLGDFSPAQLERLVAHVGLANALTKMAAERVYHWTGGQPYLSQWLCNFLAERKKSIRAANVNGIIDSAVERFFQTNTRHLIRVKRLLAEPDLLAYIRRITSESRERLSIAVNFTHFQLAHIIGVVKADSSGWCQIRNRVYERALAEVEMLFHDRLMTAQEEEELIAVDLPPEVKAQGALFLFEIGRWATSELKERWALVCQEKAAKQPAEVNLSGSKEEVERLSGALLQDVANERGAREVERVLGLIERKRGLILEWKGSKVDNEEEYNRQLIARATLRLRQQELDQKIAQTMAEIEANLKELGVQVAKEK